MGREKLNKTEQITQMKSTEFGGGMKNALNLWEIIEAEREKERKRQSETNETEMNYKN